MTDSPKLSRRDWFLLKTRHRNQMLDESSVEFSQAESSQNMSPNSANGLKPIEHPPNHDGLDLSELPPMRAATLSTEQIEALFADIQQLGTDILLMQRSTDTQRANATKIDSTSQLEMAKSALLSGTITRLQIRYRWQNKQWIDTLKQVPDGFHIVRIAQMI